MCNTAELPPLAAESTLGRLAKWMRMAGMDVQLDTGKPDPVRMRRIRGNDDRWVLTRTQRMYQALNRSGCLFIRSNIPMEQAQQVMRHFRIKRCALRPLSRCTRCNDVISPLTTDQLSGRVPDYVRRQYDQFATCIRCQRIYWPGTHARRINTLIDQWFR